MYSFQWFQWASSEVFHSKIDFADPDSSKVLKTFSSTARADTGEILTISSWRALGCSLTKLKKRASQANRSTPKAADAKGQNLDKTHMGMDQYLLIPFLGEWTSIYQLFWCSPGVQGFDTLPHRFKARFEADPILIAPRRQVPAAEFLNLGWTPASGQEFNLQDTGSINRPIYILVCFAIEEESGSKTLAKQFLDRLWTAAKELWIPCILGQYTTSKWG